MMEDRHPNLDWIEKVLVTIGGREEANKTKRLGQPNKATPGTASSRRCRRPKLDSKVK